MQAIHSYVSFGFMVYYKIYSDSLSFVGHKACTCSQVLLCCGSCYSNRSLCDLDQVSVVGISVLVGSWDWCCKSLWTSKTKWGFLQYFCKMAPREETVEIAIDSHSILLGGTLLQLFWELILLDDYKEALFLWCDKQ